ncbi:MAG: GtrA family protein [Deltaproteobacteria bacterium]|nr:MAG: GtrA family protein [Deltaproteobacteria bacterium]
MKKRILRFYHRSTRFLRASAVGIVATGVDLGTLTLLVEVLGVSKLVANWPSLLLGVLVQFLGAKYAVFKAGDGPWVRHLTGFVLAEIGTYLLNGLAFHLLVTLTPIPYVLARLVGTFVVFVTFSYPVWRWVFEDGGRPEIPEHLREDGGRDARTQATEI